MEQKYDIIRKEIIETNKLLSQIAKEQKVSNSLVSRINRGNIIINDNDIFPLRQKKEKDNDKHFAALLRKEYSTKQIHIIIGKYSYDTIVRYCKTGKPSAYKLDYELEKRKKVFDLISVPHVELINQYSYNLTKEDFIYIKFLGRMGNTTLKDVALIFLEFIEKETEFSDFPIKTEEDINRYYSWGGTKSDMLNMIKMFFINKAKSTPQGDVYFNDLKPNIFKKIDSNIDLSIVKDMINFDTKENYNKRK